MNTQQLLLSILQKTGPLTISQLSSELGLTKAAVRYQAHQLLVQELITTCPPGLVTGAGRPATRYQVNLLPNPNLSKLLIKQLSTEVMKGVNRRINPDEVADRIATSLLAPGDGKKRTKAANINLHLTTLSKLGIQLTWEASPSGPVISIKAEPLTSIISDPILAEKILQALIMKILK